MNAEWYERVMDGYNVGVWGHPTAEYCAVKRAWSLFKDHIPNWIIAPRIRASKAETFADLRTAIQDCLDAYERKMASVRGKQ